MAAPKPPRSVFAIMALSVVVGAVIGGGLGLVLLPVFAAPLALGGALTVGALTVGWLLFRDG